MEEKRRKQSIGEFISDHKVEICVATAILMSYRMGYIRGYNNSIGVIDHFLSEVGKSLKEVV